MKYLLTFTIMALCLSCNEKNLGGGYYYLPDYEAIDVGYPYGSMIYKSKSEYHYEQILIVSDLVNVRQSGDFIVVKQIPNLELYKKFVHDSDSLRGSITPNLFMNPANYYMIYQISNKMSEPLSRETLKFECQKNQINIAFLVDERW